MCYTVGGTETRAILDENTGTYKLHGLKWFSSATDSDMSLALARIVHCNGSNTTVSINNPRPLVCMN